MFAATFPEFVVLLSLPPHRHSKKWKKSCCVAVWRIESYEGNRRARHFNLYIKKFHELFRLDKRGRREVRPVMMWGISIPHASGPKVARKSLDITRILDTYYYYHYYNYIIIIIIITVLHGPEVRKVFVSFWTLCHLTTITTPIYPHR